MSAKFRTTVRLTTRAHSRDRAQFAVQVILGDYRGWEAWWGEVKLAYQMDQGWIAVCRNTPEDIATYKIAQAAYQLADAFMAPVRP